MVEDSNGCKKFFFKMTRGCAPRDSTNKHGGQKEERERERQTEPEQKGFVKSGLCFSSSFTNNVLFYPKLHKHMVIVDGFK